MQENFRAEIDTLRRQLIAEMNQKTMFQEELNSAMQKIQELNLLIEEKDNLLYQKNDQNIIARNQVQAEQSELHQEKQYNQQLSARIVKQEQIINDLQSEIDILKNQSSMNQQELQTLQKEIAIHNKQLEKCHKQINFQEEEISNKNIDFINLQRTKEKIQQRAIEAETAIEMLQKVIAQFKLYGQKQTHKLNQERKKNAELVKQMSEIAGMPLNDYDNYALDDEIEPDLSYNIPIPKFLSQPPEENQEIRLIEPRLHRQIKFSDDIPIHDEIKNNNPLKEKPQQQQQQQYEDENIMLVDVPIPELHRRRKNQKKDEEFSATFSNIFGSSEQNSNSKQQQSQKSGKKVVIQYEQKAERNLSESPFKAIQEKMSAKESQLAQFEDKLLQLNIKKDNLFNEYQQIMKSKLKSASNQKKKLQLEAEQEAIDNEISSVRLQLRAIQQQ